MYLSEPSNALPTIISAFKNVTWVFVIELNSSCCLIPVDAEIEMDSSGFCPIPADAVVELNSSCCLIPEDADIELNLSCCLIPADANIESNLI